MWSNKKIGGALSCLVKMRLCFYKPDQPRGASAVSAEMEFLRRRYALSCYSKTFPMCMRQIVVDKLDKKDRNIFKLMLRIANDSKEALNCAELEAMMESENEGEWSDRTESSCGE